MVGPLVFGVVASTPLVVGALVGAYLDVPDELNATTLAFASGALVTALAYDLFEHSVREADVPTAGAGLLAGAVVFTGVDYLIDSRYGEDSSGFGLLASVTLDGVPENTALGVVLIGTSSPLALLAAIFASNFPEALGSAKSLVHDQNRSKRYAVGVWTAAAVLLAASVVAGNSLFDGLGPQALSLVRSFAGGAVVASLATEVMPEAYEEGGTYVGVATAAGFLLTFVLN